MRLILDSCADSSFVKRSTIETLKIPQFDSCIEKLRGIGGKLQGHKTSSSNIFLMPIFPSSAYIEVTCRVLDDICGDLPATDFPWEGLPDASTLQLTEPLPRPAGPVHVLVGQDVLADILCGNVLKGGKNNRTLLWQTIFGTAISGRPAQSSQSECRAFAQQIAPVAVEEDLNALLKRFWELEAFGLLTNHELLSPDEKFCVDHFNSNVTFADGRYTVALPFSKFLPKPLNNYESALAQFRSLERSLLASKAKYDAFLPVMMEYITLGHVEEVQTDTPGTDEAFYLPFHPVFRAGHESHKVRVVFNGSAGDRDNYSLNDALLTGPALQPLLASIVNKFRQQPIALCSDIKKHFLNINIRESDRNWIRFLWRLPGSAGGPAIMRFKVVPFGLRSSPFLAINTIWHHLALHRKDFPEACDSLRSSLYVDDYLGGAASVPAAIQLRKDITEVMALGGFPMVKWVTNDLTVLATIPEELRGASAPRFLTEKISDNSAEPSKALGIQWEPAKDCFTFQAALELMLPIRVETMRTLASRAAKLYDPCGWLAPTIVMAKVLMQNCWKMSLKWDSVLPPEISTPWDLWTEDLVHIHHIDIPRALFQPKYVSYQIHGFSDASEMACCAAVYIRSVDAAGDILVRLVTSKTIVAPLHKASIPRLELVGCLLLARLVKFVSKDLPTAPTVLWTDSTTALCWLLKPPSAWKTFVANRVAEIQSLYDASHFRHCPTGENPSDSGTRGINGHDMCHAAQWFQGPSFLELEEEAWPESPLPAATTFAAAEEKVVTTIPFLLVATWDTGLMAEIFDRGGPGRSFERSLRQLAFLLRFANNIRDPATAVKQQWPTKRELDKALLVWLLWVQSRTLDEEMAALKNAAHKKTAYMGKLKELQPIVAENGLILVGGRCQYSGDMKYEAKHPIILPAGDKYVASFVLSLHKAAGCPGPETMLAYLRAKYWPLQGRRSVKSMIRKCVRCMRLRAVPFKQVIAPLPQRRTEFSIAFTHAAVDLGGPYQVLVVPPGNSKRKRKVKLDKKGKIIPLRPDEEPRFHSMWIVVFSCLTSRAVHVDYMWSCQTEDFVNALQRFIARRGCPETLTLDNAKYFKKAERELDKLYRNLQTGLIQKHMMKTPAQIRFIFSPERSPHWGGVFETTIKAVKVALKATLGNCRADYEEFRCACAMAEMTVNSRPLTTVSDSGDDPLPLTPSMLLLGRPLLPIPDDLGRDDRNDTVAIQWRKRSRLNQEFALRWRKEYLAGLQRYQKWLVPGYAPKIGEIVLVNDAPKSRLDWPLARVTALHPSWDNNVRRVSIHLRGMETRRDSRMLYRLEGLIHE